VGVNILPDDGHKEPKHVKNSYMNCGDSASNNLMREHFGVQYTEIFLLFINVTLSKEQLYV
jgi:hypothetical protein